MARINLDDDLNYVNLENKKETVPAASSAGKKKKKKSRKKGLNRFLMDSLYILTVLILAVLFVKFVAQRTTVIGSSMEPTLSDGDNLIVDKLSYNIGEPKRFDVIVFPFQYEEHTYYINDRGACQSFWEQI